MTRDAKEPRYLKLCSECPDVPNPHCFKCGGIGLTDPEFGYDGPFIIIEHDPENPESCLHC